MGIEGQKSPRDVAGEEKKHPWEIFPEDDTSAENGGKSRKKRLEKKAKREKRKAKINSLKTWIKGHKALAGLMAFLLVVIIAGGVFLIVQLTKPETEAPTYYEHYDSAFITYDFPDDYNIKDSFTSKDAYRYANTKIRKIALEGVDVKTPDVFVIEDNMDAYIKTLKTEYEKNYFELYKICIIAEFENLERAKFLLEKFEDKKIELDKRQLYMYYRAYISYYEQLGDDEKYAEYSKKIADDFTDEDFIMVDERTGELIEGELLEELKNNLKKHGQEI